MTKIQILQHATFASGEEIVIQAIDKQIAISFLSPFGTYHTVLEEKTINLIKNN